MNGSDSYVMIDVTGRCVLFTQELFSKRRRVYRYSYKQHAQLLNDGQRLKDVY
jgi:hypothetical protein